MMVKEKGKGVIYSCVRSLIQEGKEVNEVREAVLEWGGEEIREKIGEKKEDEEVWTGHTNIRNWIERKRERKEKEKKENEERFE